MPSHVARTPWLSLPALLVLLFTLSGCSTSSDSISKSISSPFKWSSDSSTSITSQVAREQYREDIRNYADAYTRSGNATAGITRGLARIGEQHGLTDWEAEAETYKGLGEGFAKAGLSQAQLQAYLQVISRGDAMKTAAIMKGFQGQ